MNKNLRKRKIKILMKIAKNVSSILGISWQDYVDKTGKSFDKWNWDSYKIDSPVYGYDITNEEKRSMNEKALVELRVEYTNFYSAKEGLKYSDINYNDLEKLSFEDYKDWYSSLLKKNNVTAISPAKAIVKLREEVYNFSEAIFVEPDVVKNYSLKNINLDIACADYRKSLSEKYKVLNFKSFNNMLESGVSRWPIIKYICYKDILYKVKNFSEIDKKLSRYGKIQANVDIPFKDLVISNHIYNNAEIILQDQEGVEYSFFLSDPEDFAFIRTWIPYGKGRTSYALVGMSPYLRNPLDWVRSEVTRGASENSETVKVGGHMGIGAEEVFDLSKSYDGDGPFIYFEIGEREMTIMSDEKNEASNWAEIANIASVSSEWAEAALTTAGLTTSNPYVLAASVFFSLADYACSWIYTSKLKEINKIDIGKLTNSEHKFLTNLYDLKQELERSEAAVENSSEEHGMLAASLVATSTALDVFNDQIANFTTSRFPGIGSPGRVAMGIQALTVAISFWDAIEGIYKKDPEKTKEMSAAEDKARVIIKKIKK